MKEMSIHFDFSPCTRAIDKNFGIGFLKVSINNTPVWYSRREEKKISGVNWSWDELLSFFVSNWVWLINEQNFPLGGKQACLEEYSSPLEMCKKYEDENSCTLTDSQRTSVFHFCERHDLSLALPGIVLPSIFVLRINNYMLFSSKSEKTVLSLREAVEIFEKIGDEIAAELKKEDAEYYSPLLDAWENKNKELREIIAIKRHLLFSMKENEFNLLKREFNELENIQYDGPIVPENSISAAARRSAAGKILLKDQIYILRKINEYKNRKKNEKLDTIYKKLKGLQTTISSYETHEQGYILADNFLANTVGNFELNNLHLEDIIKELDIEIIEEEWPESNLDALSCWTDKGKPIIFLNCAEGRPSRHINGKRFTLGHELCHIIVDLETAEEIGSVFLGKSILSQEKRANAFSAELLLPQFKVDNYLRSMRENDEDFDSLIKEIAQSNLVPAQCVIAQIYNRHTIPLSKDLENYLEKKLDINF